ncbi:MAG: 3-phosphoshikimate 1-carboxyvinyltransferase, partial [Aquihabitans sp.]
MAIDLTDLTSLPDPYRIEMAQGPLDATVRVPGSKSITNRALVCAALATGTSVLEGALFADDTYAMVSVLRALTISVDSDPDLTRITVVGTGGTVPASEDLIDVRQSGTTARFALPMLALGEGNYRVTADEQMQSRPMDATFAALREMGAGIEELGATNHLPATVSGGVFRSGVLSMPGDISSQYLSGLLLVGPCLADGLIIELTTNLVSRPYVDLTVAVMKQFGAVVDQPDAHTFAVAPGGYRGCTYPIEPDASAASYPLAAAAICGGRVRVQGLPGDALQGDAQFAEVLRAMGATVVRDEFGTEVRAEGGTLSGGTFDLTHISDTAQTLAVVAPFATEPITVTGIGFIRRKETDRVAAVASELSRAGIDVRVDPDGWTIT